MDIIRWQKKCPKVTQRPAKRALPFKISTFQYFLKTLQTKVSADFTLTLFQEITKQVKELAEKLEHSNCLSENHGSDKFGPIDNITIVKDPEIINKDVANEKNRSMFTPKMLGLNTPE